jgi:chitin synthase
MYGQFEPWHMITSFVQYLLMAPSYIAVLNVYAVSIFHTRLSTFSQSLYGTQFANVHDVSWGTKGDNKVSTDLGVVTTGKNKNEVEVAVPTAEKDINAAYEDAIHVLSTKPPKAEPKVDAATDQEDYYRTFRTKYAYFCSSSGSGLVLLISFSVVFFDSVSVEVIVDFYTTYHFIFVRFCSLGA